MISMILFGFVALFYCYYAFWLVQKQTSSLSATAAAEASSKIVYACRCFGEANHFCSLLVSLVIVDDI